MKKYKFLILFLFIFCIPTIVFADEKNPTCSDIRNKYNEYTGVINEYNNLVCDNASDTSTYEACKTLVYEKYDIIEDLYSYNEKNSDCDISEVNDLLEENSDTCSNSISSELKDLASTVMNIFYMIAPFLLIIFGSIDFFKIIVNGDPKTIKKNRTNFFKRIIAFVLLYFTPVLVNIILSFAVYDLGASRYICDVTIAAPQTMASNEANNTIIYSGVYGIDNATSYDSEGSGKIVRAADSISKTWANQNFRYFTDDPPAALQYANINLSIDNPTKGTCCATLAAAALYKSGLITEAEINSISYNGAYNIAEMLDNKKWQIIESYDSLKPGDIVFMSSSSNAPITLRNGKTYNQGHVQIYAGGNKWYNAGSTPSIQGSQPSTQGESYVRGRFLFAMRYPAPAKTNRSSTSKTNSNSSSSGNSSSSTSGSTSVSTSTDTSNKGTNDKSTPSSSSSSNSGIKGTNDKSTPSSGSSSSSSSSSNSGSKGTNTKKTNTKKTK